jgi:hypothetical protein
LTSLTSGVSRRVERTSAETSARIGYETEQFIVFFKRGLQHIIELNAVGVQMQEVYSGLLLQRILTPYATNYVDLQSPAGIGISVLAYNYDGDVYATVRKKWNCSPSFRRAEVDSPS